MIIQVLHCPNCQGTDIVRHGQTRQGKQRYCCREKRCAGRTFLLEYAYASQSPEVKQQIVDSNLFVTLPKQHEVYRTVQQRWGVLYAAYHQRLLGQQEAQP